MSNTMAGCSAVLVDEHPMWLNTVEHVLSDHEVNVVATSSSCRAAAKLVEDVAPDLLVAEVLTTADDGAGMALVSGTKERLPDTRIVVFSMLEDAHHVRAALAAGADAYVLKTAHPDDLVAAIRQAFRHSIFLPDPPGPEPPPATVSRPTAVPDEAAGLTPRELEILRLVAEGHSNAELARLLWVTEQTVKFHLSNIYRKLEVSNRTEASRWAQLRGILSTDIDALPAAG
jgi:DNA-binding NarL/FixJ family response regulator